MGSGEPQLPPGGDDDGVEDDGGVGDRGEQGTRHGPLVGEGTGMGTAGTGIGTTGPQGGAFPELLPGSVPLARPMQIGADTGWSAADWAQVRERAERAGRAYVWLHLVEARLRSLVGVVLRPVYAPVHGEEWILAAAGPAGREWVQRAAAVREVSRRKGYLLDPLDDDVLAFLTLPQLRELLVQHWPCFEPYVADRRELELALDELEVARSAVARNRALSPVVLAQTERTSGHVLALLGAWDGGVGTTRGRLPADALEQLTGERFGDVVGVHPDRVRLQRRLPAEELFGGARRLDAVGIGLNLLVQNYSGRRLVRLAETGCRARLLFLNPASSAMRRRERELGLKRGEIARAVETNILHMRRVRARLRDPDAFEVRVFDETPRFTAYLVDGDGADPVGVVQPYLRRARGMESPVFVLRGPDRSALTVADGAGGASGGEPGLFSCYQEEFDSSWQDARPVS